MHDLIAVTCPACHMRFATGEPLTDKPLVCPGCAQPLPSLRALQHLRQREPERVPVNLELPGGRGHLQTQVSQRAADSLIHTLLGGLLVALGGILAWFFFTQDEKES